MIGHPAGIFNNHAKTYRCISVRPLAAAMGAEITGVHLSKLRDEAFEEVRDALYRHKMVYFRGQDINHADQEAFAARFGPFAEDAYTDGVDGFANVQPVIKEADAEVAIIFGSGWHTDSPFLERPPAISILRGVDIPPYGGDTMWANTALAFSTLSTTMQEMLSPLQVHMSIQHIMVRMYRARIDGTSQDKLKSNVAESSDPELTRQKITGACHPLVRSHPVTGEKALYCDETYTTNIAGMLDEEAKPILNFLTNHITQAAFTCRLRWQPNTIALWDNRLCIHQAFNDHDGFRREMYRSTVAG